MAGLESVLRMGALRVAGFRAIRPSGESGWTAAAVAGEEVAPVPEGVRTELGRFPAESPLPYRPRSRLAQWRTGQVFV